MSDFGMEPCLELKLNSSNRMKHLVWCGKSVT